MYMVLEIPIYTNWSGNNRVYQYTYDEELNVIPTDYYTLEINGKLFKIDNFKAACYYADRGVVPEGTEELDKL